MRSWDRAQIPKPFSTMTIAIGEPMTIAGTEDQVVTAGRQALEDRLRTLEQRAISMLR